MKAPPVRRFIAGVPLAVVCFIAAFLFPMVAPELAMVSKAMIILGGLAVALPTFQWGAALGYRVQSDDGTLQLGPILRCATMTAILGFIALGLAAIIVGLCAIAFR